MRTGYSNGCPCGCSDRELNAPAPAVEPAPPAAADTDIVVLWSLTAYLQQRFAPPGPFGHATRDWRIEAEQLLSGPLASLVADADAVRRVRELHRSRDGQWCDGCDYAWLCQTLRALDGRP